MTNEQLLVQRFIIVFVWFYGYWYQIYYGFDKCDHLFLFHLYIISATQKAFDCCLCFIFREIVFLRFREIIFPGFREIIFPRFREIIFPCFKEIIFPRFRDIIFPRFREIIFLRFREIIFLHFREIIFLRFREIIFPRFREIIFPRWQQIQQSFPPPPTLCFQPKTFHMIKN